MVVWVTEGNFNNKFFHHFSSRWKLKNSIRDIWSEEGRIVNKFGEISGLGVTYFSKIFEEQYRGNLG